MNTYIWGGSERNDVYFDEPNRHELVTYRMDASFLANQLSAEGKKDKAVEVLDKVMTNVTEHAYAYDYTAYFMAAAYYKAGAVAKGDSLSMKLTRNAEQYVNWIASLNEEGKASMADEVKQQFQIMQNLSTTAYQAGDSITAKRIFDKIQIVAPKVKDLLNTRSMPQSAGEEE
jgi:hypothetical protein